MKLRFKHTICVLALLASPLFMLHAQVQVSAGIDSTSILIGNQAHIHLTAAYDIKNGLPKIQWPAIGDTISQKLVVISKSKIDTVIPDSSSPDIQQQRQEITVTGFDSGYYAIPPFRFLLNGDTSNSLLTEAMMLQVNTVQVDTNKTYKDIKAPLSAPFTILEILPYIGYALIAAIILGGLIYFVVRSLKKKKPVIVEKPKIIISPHVKALQDLENLAQQKLWQEGKIKDYYTGLTDILRVYIWERYGVTAPEMTTDEIMLALKRKTMSDFIKEKLRQILVLADLVKFAKEKPLPHEHEFCYTASVEFVNETAERAEAAPLETPGEATPLGQNPVTA